VRRVRREQHRGRQVVDAHCSDRAAERGPDAAEVAEQRRRAVPQAAGCAEPDGESEQEREHTDVDDLVDAARFHPRGDDGADADTEDRQRR